MCMCVCVCVCVCALKQSVLCWNLLFVAILITVILHVRMCVFVAECRHTIVILMFMCVRVYQRVHMCANINAVLMRL